MHQNNKHSFENFIIQCCKAKEWDLRKFLKKKLIKNGFIIIEDNYLSRRCSKTNKYSGVHNLLAIRGNPRVCLVAHTDVCRDHPWRDNLKEPDVFPVIKEWENGESKRFVIQDKDCEHQTGGDDRLGVAINTWIALNTGYDIALLFTTDEEIGLVSAHEVSFPELKKFDLLLQVDRGNNSNQLVSRIGGTQLCSPMTTKRLLKIAEEMGVPRQEVNGLPTDVAALIRRGVAREAVNMTCGYHNSYGDSEKEYIDIEEARSTMRFVADIVKYYDLELDKEEIIEAEELGEKEKEEDDFEEIEYLSNSELGDNELEEDFSIENYIEIISKPKQKVYKKLNKNRKKRKYIEVIFDDNAVYFSEHERDN